MIARFAGKSAIISAIFIKGRCYGCSMFKRKFEDPLTLLKRSSDEFRQVLSKIKGSSGNAASQSDASAKKQMTSKKASAAHSEETHDSRHMKKSATASKKTSLEDEPSSSSDILAAKDLLTLSQEAYDEKIAELSALDNMITSQMHLLSRLSKEWGMLKHSVEEKEAHLMHIDAQIGEIEQEIAGLAERQ